MSLFPPTTPPRAAVTLAGPAGRPQVLRLLGSGGAWGLATLVTITIIATIGITAFRDTAFEIQLSHALQPPSAAHPMGTDREGRDVFSRFSYGAANSLLTAFGTTTISLLLGGVLGVLAASARGLVDIVVLRLLDILLAFPPLILAMVVTIGLGPGLHSAIIGISLGTLPFTVRLLRSEILRIRALPMIEAEQALGASGTRILTLHVLPQAAPTLLAQLASVFGHAVVALAGLSFIGLGIAPPTPDWGNMITEGMSTALTGQWWTTVFPGLGILALSASSFLLARSLQRRLQGGWG